MTIKNRKVAEELVLHSDQEVQFANSAFANTLEYYKKW